MAIDSDKLKDSMMYELQEFDFRLSYLGLIGDEHQMNKLSATSRGRCTTKLKKHQPKHQRKEITREERGYTLDTGTFSKESKAKFHVTHGFKQSHKNNGSRPFILQPCRGDDVDYIADDAYGRFLEMFLKGCTQDTTHVLAYTSELLAVACNSLEMSIRNISDYFWTANEQEIHLDEIIFPSSVKEKVA